MEKEILSIILITIGYGLCMWGLLKFHRYGMKKNIIKTVREAVKNGSITEEQGINIESAVEIMYKRKKKWKKY